MNSEQASAPFELPGIEDPAESLRQDYVDAVRSGDSERIEAFLLGVAHRATAWPGLPKLPQVLNSLPKARAATIAQRLTERWGKLPELRAASSSTWGPSAGTGPLSPWSPLQALLLKAVTLGHAAAHRELGRRPHLRWHQHASGDAIARMIDAMPKPKSLRRPLIVDDGSEVIQSAPAGLTVTAVVFTGLADRATFDLPVFDSFLAARGVNAVYLRDFSRSLFLHGVDALGPDRDSSCSALKRLIYDFGGERLVCIGNSAGGFAAMDWSHELRPDHIIGLSAPTNVSLEFVEAIGERRAAAVARRVAALHSRERLDLRTQLVDADPRTPITLHYGEAMELDRAHALALADLPQVELRPTPGYPAHDVLFPITWSGGIDALFAPCEMASRR
jgi:hypothetical protein